MGHVQAVQGARAGDAHPCKGIGAALQSPQHLSVDGRKIQEQWESIVDMGLTVPEVAYDMIRSLAMDLETCSVVGSNGRFLVYAIGFRYMDRKVQLIAQTVEDLRGGLMWRAVQECVGTIGVGALQTP